MTYSRWQSEAALNQYRDSELFKSVWSFTKALFFRKASGIQLKKNAASRGMSL